MSQFFNYGELLKPNKYGMFGLNSFGTKGTGYQNLSDPGGMLFGGSGEYNSLGMKRDGTKGGFFGDKAQGIDYFGSPVTAGTNAQGTARLGALLYGGAMAGGALAGGGAGASSGAAGGGATAGGAGSATGGVSAGAAGGGLAATGGGTAGGATAGGTTSGTISGGAGSGAATANSGAPSASQGGSPAWMRFARMGAQGMNMGQKNSYQPNMYMIDDGVDENAILARLLRAYGG